MMLEGFRIVEVEGLGPGPFAGMLLSDLGADVIVVHRPDAVGTPGIPEQPILDRGKRSITLDLKNVDDCETFKQITADADALIEGFRPGVMERLGLGPDVCMAVNPRLVYGRMTGWGQEGALSRTAGHDLNYISLSGAAWYASPAGTPPFTPPTLVGDIGGGALYLVVGILSGLLNAQKTGEGTVVDAAIVDGSAHMMNLLMTLCQSGGMSIERGQGLLDGPHWSRTYRTKDEGFISVQCLEPKFYAIFLQQLGLATDPEFTQQYNKDLWPRLTDRLTKIFAVRSRADWESVFENTDACVAPVLNPEEAMAHPINTERGTWLVDNGVIQAAGAPRFSTENTWQPRDIPWRGEHNQEILAELRQQRGD